MRFVQQKITLYATDEWGVKKVELLKEATVAIGAGLAYHPFLCQKEKPGYWAITHVASGLQIGDEFIEDQEFAERFIVYLASLTDWRKDKQELLESLSKANIKIQLEQQRFVATPVQEVLF